MNIFIRRAILLLLILLFSITLLTQWGCGGSAGKLPLVLAATSDLEETGILQEWVRDFGSRSGLEVLLAVDSDRNVVKMAQHGECDLLITHAPDLEEQLERSNYVESRQEIMRDDYIIVGPPNDPAGVGDAENVDDAAARVVGSRAPFVLRIDGSGTSYEQDNFLASAGVVEKGDWLVEVDAGMADALREASSREAYTLSGRSNYRMISGELDLEVLYEGGETLDNPYSVLGVSSLAYPDTDTEGAEGFISYLLSDDARRFFDLGAWEPPL